MIKTLALVAVFAGLVLGAPQQLQGPVLDGRIVGGWDTTIEEHPYQVSLERFNSHFCGGVIISSNWVLTAGHCVVAVNIASAYTIRTESTIRNSGGSVYAVATIILHEDYVGSPVPDFDIAALLIATPIQFAAGAQPIGIVPQGTGPVAGVETVITGWGALVQGGAGSTVLQEVRIPTISQAVCRAIYSPLTDNMFCAGLLGEGGKDACQGDSGSPVVISGVVAGLVSWGSGCAQPDFPGVQTNLFLLREWILEKTGV